MKSTTLVGFTLLKIASIYMMAALILGMVMGMSHSFALISVHSHIGLLGWLTMAVTGLVYVAAPGCDGNRLSKLHFWLHNLGLPVMVFSLTWSQYSASPQLEAATGVGSALVLVALLLFTVNLFVNCRHA
jgi:cbb3-type cytochrome oxidase subunit 1